MKYSDDPIDFEDVHKNQISASRTFCAVDKCYKLLINQENNRIDITQELLDKLLEVYRNIEFPKLSSDELFSFEDYEK